MPIIKPEGKKTVIITTIIISLVFIGFIFTTLFFNYFFDIFDGLTKNNQAEVSNLNKNREKSNYRYYSSDLIVDNQFEKTILFFKADWCGSCRILDKNLKKDIADIPKDTLIIDVDYDQNQELNRKYQITYPHVLVQVDKNGEVIKKWTSSRNLNALLNQVI